MSNKLLILKDVAPFIFTILLTAFASQAIHIATAQACDPAPSHNTAIISDDTPECLQIEDYDNWDGSITLRNECDQIFELQSTNCEACDSQASIEPGAEPYELSIDSREATELDGQTTEQSYTWTLGEQEGVLETEVYFNDISDACSGFGGCSSSKSSAPIGDTSLIFLFVLVLFLRSYGAIAVAQN